MIYLFSALFGLSRVSLLGWGDVRQLSRSGENAGLESPRMLLLTIICNSRPLPQNILKSESAATVCNM